MKRMVFCLTRPVMILPVFFALLLASCAEFQTGKTAKPLDQAQQRLAKAERQGLDPEGRASEFLAAAKMVESQLGSRGEAQSGSEAAATLDLYNRATADLAAELPALIRQQRNSSTLLLRDPQSGQINQLKLESGGPGEYPTTYFEQILVADRVNKKGMRDNVVRTGIGGTVVGVHHSSAVGTPPPRLEPLKGLRANVTAILDFDRSDNAVEHLRLLDPTKDGEVIVRNKRYTLAGDFTAAEASYGRINEIWIGLMNMIRGEHMRGAAGLLLLQPYDSEKVPVIFVHGLLSTPFAWRNVANSLRVDPEIRRRYQFWVFSYSTGNPIAYSALLLRRDLAFAEQSYHFRKAILIGHSMGGILSRLQVTNTKRVLWDGVFGPKANALFASEPQDSIIKQVLIFSSNPTVSRVIFVATPHRGSALSTGGIGALGIRLIRLPLKVVNAVPKAVIAAVTTDPRKFRAPNSISGLSPKNPLLLALDKLPIEAPHNSIIGDRGRDDTPNSSDGVVPYWSSHLSTAQSELIVPTDHGAMNHPKAVEEIRRILLQQLGTADKQKSPRKVRRTLTRPQTMPASRTTTTRGRGLGIRKMNSSSRMAPKSAPTGQGC